MSSVTFGGLVSGLDTNGIIDKLVAIEKQPIKVYQAHQSDDNTKLSTLAAIITKVQALSDASNALATSSKANPVAATSSDTSRIASLAGAGATSGSYSIVVDHLARAQANSSTRLNSNATPGAGSLSFTVAGNAPVTVSYQQGDTLDSVASSINGLAAGVVASVLNDGKSYRLIVSSSQTGIANGFSVAEQGVALGLSDPGAQTAAPLDSAFSLNGIDITRASNHVTDAISNVTLDLRSATPVGGAATAVTVGTDQAALTTKVQALVTAYNDVANALSAQLAFTGTRKGPSTLFGDGALRDLQKTISGSFGTGYGASALSAGLLGVSLQKDGTLTFDAAKLQSALATDPTAAQRLFTGDNTPGLAQKLKLSLDTYIRPVDGRLVAKQDALNADVKSYDKLITQTTSAASSFEARLRQQFSNMEKALSLMQQQSGLISGLTLSNTSTTSVKTSSSSTSG